MLWFIKPHDRNPHPEALCDKHLTKEKLYLLIAIDSRVFELR